jgi:hypothetical protein
MFEAVSFLESMGLPKPLLKVTRKEVEQGKHVEMEKQAA